MVLSGADGVFQIAVPPGRGVLVVYGPTKDYIYQSSGTWAFKTWGTRHYFHGALSLDLQAGAAPPEPTISIRRGVTIAGRLVDPAGRPVAEAMMLSRLCVSNDVAGFRCFPTVVREGRFDLHGLDPKTSIPVCFLDAKNQLGAVAEIPGKSADGQPVVVRLSPCGKAVARFVRPDGKPLAKHSPDLQIVVTPGPFPGDQKRYRKELSSDQDFVANFDREHYGDEPLTDEGGRCTFPALIPGATYRLHLMNESGDWDEKDFTVKSGKTLRLPDIVIREPGTTVPAGVGAKAKDRAPANAADAGARKPGQTSAATKTAEPARVVPVPPASTKPFMAGFPSGITVELLGISRHPSSAASWWRPDGSPLAEPPCDTLKGSVGGGTDHAAREFAVQWRNLPAEPVGTEVSFEPTYNAFAGGDSKRLGKKVAGLETMTVSLPDRPTVTVRASLADGPWQTVYEGGTQGGSVGTMQGGFAFSPIQETAGGIAVTVTHNILGPQSRVVAVGRDGKEHRASSCEGAGAANFLQVTATFPGLSRKAVKAFRVQTRPYRHVEFRNVSLRPGQKTDVQIVPLDAPRTAAAKPDEHAKGDPKPANELDRSGGATRQAAPPKRGGLGKIVQALLDGRTPGNVAEPDGGTFHLVRGDSTWIGSDNPPLAYDEYDKNCYTVWGRHIVVLPRHTEGFWDFYRQRTLDPREGRMDVSVEHPEPLGNIVMRGTIDLPTYQLLLQPSVQQALNLSREQRRHCRISRPSTGLREGKSQEKSSPTWNRPHTSALPRMPPKRTTDWSSPARSGGTRLFPKRSSRGWSSNGARPAGKSKRC